MSPTPPFSLAHVAVALSVGLFSSHSFASDQRTDCPTEIPAASIRITDTPAGWTPFVPASLVLTAAGFMQASPEKMALLKPFSTSENKKRMVVKWKFEGDYPQGKWLNCDYAGGATSLSKEIARSTSECTVIYDKKNKGRAGFIQVTCK